MTEWTDEIATLFNQRTVGFLAMTFLYRYFHSHLVPQSGKRISKIKGGIEK